MNIQGSKDNLINSCMYYINTLRQNNIDDVKKEVVDVIATSLKISEVQEKYLINSKEVDLKKILNNMNIILDHNKNNLGDDYMLLKRSIQILKDCIQDKNK